MPCVWAGSRSDPVPGKRRRAPAHLLAHYLATEVGAPSVERIPGAPWCSTMLLQLTLIVCTLGFDGFALRSSIFSTPAL